MVCAAMRGAPGSRIADVVGCRATRFGVLASVAGEDAEQGGLSGLRLGDGRLDEFAEYCEEVLAEVVAWFQSSYMINMDHKK